MKKFFRTAKTGKGLLRGFLAGGILAGALLIFMGTAPVKAAESWDFDYSDLRDTVFMYSSGVGAWRTELFFGNSGDFWGSYSDSDMGDTGEGYPNGTRYVCEFYGQFSDPVKIDDYTYELELQFADVLNEEGTSEIVDGVLERYTEPAGIEGCDIFYLYLPGTPKEKLSEDFLMWVHFAYYEDDGWDTLPFYALCNTKTQGGFSSYYKETASPFAELVDQAWEDSNDLEWSLKYDDLTQSEMNQISYQIYEIWDGCLNDMWAVFREELPLEPMDTLTEEEIRWINLKEESIRRAGLRVQGGSMQSMVENETATSWTKQRIYSLLMNWVPQVEFTRSAMG